MSAETARLSAMRRAHDHSSETGFILTLLLANDWRNGNESFPSVETLMDRTGYGKDLIRNRLKWLAEQGIIRDTGKRRKAGKGPGVRVWEVPSAGVDLLGIGRVSALDDRPIESDGIGREYGGNRAAIGRVSTLGTRRDLDLDLELRSSPSARRGTTGVAHASTDDDEFIAVQLHRLDLDALQPIYERDTDGEYEDAREWIADLLADALDTLDADPNIRRPHNWLDERIKGYVHHDSPSALYGLVGFLTGLAPGDAAGDDPYAAADSLTLDPIANTEGVPF